MKLATLDLTPELFVEFAKACSGVGSRRFRVKANPLPNDAVIERIGLRPPGVDSHALRLFIRSETFADVLEGAEPPELPPVVFETVFE